MRRGGGREALIREIRAQEPRAAILYIPQTEADREAELHVLTETRPWEKFLRPGRRYHVILLPDRKNNNLGREFLLSTWENAAF